VNYDNDLGYRCEEEFQDWKAKDPIEHLKNKLFKENLLTNKEFDDIKEEHKIKILAAVKFAKESPFPDKEELGTHIYDDDNNNNQHQSN
jgi:TPP-dependent pyruvate/acetoin dehydrogenase alpha subunit